jgi:hypothetical protein
LGAAPPITGVFAFAGVGLHQGLGDYCEWRNANGGVAGRKLRYIGEDSGYKMDQAMSVFKKIMGAHKPPVFYGDSTAWAKAAAAEVSQLGTTLTTSPSFASDLADPVKAPYYFMAGPTYEAMIEIQLEYINAQAKGGAKPAVAIVYSDTEFGRDPIEGAKKHETPLASTGPGSPSDSYARLLNETIGTKYKVVRGYPGSTDGLLAVERGEMDGLYLSDSSAANYVKNGQARGIAEPGEGERSGAEFKGHPHVESRP